MRSEQEARNRRVQEITEEIASLSAELQDLLSIGESNQPVVQRPRQNRAGQGRVTVYQQEQIRPISVGDRVQILNSYRGLRCYKGMVTRYSTSRVWFNLDSTGENTFREKQNLKRID